MWDEVIARIRKRRKSRNDRDEIVEQLTAARQEREHMLKERLIEINNQLVDEFGEDRVA